MGLGLVEGLSKGPMINGISKADGNSYSSRQHMQKEVVSSQPLSKD